MTINITARGSLLQHRLRVTMSCTVALLSALLTWVCSAQARIVPLGSDFQVNTVTDGAQLNPQVVALPDGGFVIVWDVAGGEMFRPPARGRRFDAAGMGVGPEFALQGVVGARAIAANDDRLVVSWFDHVSRNLLVGNFTLDGVLRTIPPVYAAANTFLGFSVAATPRSEVIWVWSEVPDSGPEIVGQRLDANLHPVGPSVLVTSPGPDNQNPGFLTAVSRADGSWIVIWEDNPLGALWGRQYDAQNTPVGERFAVVESAQVEVVGAAIRVDDSGGFVVAWQDLERPIEFRRYDAQAQPLTLRLNTALNTAVQAGPVRLACLPDRSLVTVGFAFPGPSVNQIVARAFDGENRPFGQFVTPLFLFGGGISVATLYDGTFVVAWGECVVAWGECVVAWDECVDRSRIECDIFARQFTLAPGDECAGDCNGDGAVTIDELITAVNIALDYNPARPESCLETNFCPAIETDLGCQVSVAEILAAVGRALEGCE